MASPRRSGANTIPGGPFQSYTPVLTAATVDPTLGTGSVQIGFFFRLRRLIVGTAFIKFGTSGALPGTGAYRISYPVAAKTPAAGEDIIIRGGGHIIDATPAKTRPVSLRHEGLTTMSLWSPDSGNSANLLAVTDAFPLVFAASDTLAIFFGYEAAGD